MINSQMPLDENQTRRPRGLNNGARAALAEQARSLLALWQKQS